MNIRQFYRQIDEHFEYCFNIGASEPMTSEELQKLTWLLAETFEPEKFKDVSFFDFDGGKEIVELGPRLNFETAFSTHLISICRSWGLNKIARIEKSRRYILPEAGKKSQFISENHDRMTECLYPKPLESFGTDIVPERVFEVLLVEKGIQALREINETLGLGMDDWDVQFNHNLFVNVFKRNPTNVECFQLGQANSEHSRHWFFKGKMVIDSVKMPETLMDIIKLPLKASPSNSIIAFKDNSNGIKGYDVWTIIPREPGKCSPLELEKVIYHIIFTAETHNFPCGVAPFPGAETGTGGRIRDIQATGRGGLVVAGTAGYCTGNLMIPDYPISGEDKNFVYPSNLASPIRILIGESNGASDYGNKFGEPVIQGFVRTFGIRLPDAERREWVKPIMFTGGVGQIDSRHIEKWESGKSMLVLQIGGPAYRIGVGGGAASSMLHGQNIEELDFNAVQRGDAEMEQKMNRVIRACIEMGDRNPIISIHDQGAGGPCNVLTELVNPAGGRIEIRNIKVGDKTMSVLEIWGAEYQERNAVLIFPEHLAEFQAICQREKVNCEVLGEITGDGKIVVHDSSDNSTPVNLDLEKILRGIPQKTFKLERVAQKREPLKLPENLNVREALHKVFKLPSVGSKGYLVRKVDRSVTGLIARQQCCGPLQLPVSDVAVIAQSHFGLTGAAISIGEQPIKMLVNPKAGARMAIGEALTNMVWVQISDIEHIKCSVNWMWAAKLLGEGVKLYDAAVAIRDLMIHLGIAADGGKDSLSMAAKVGKEMVKAPGQMVISAYATTPDIRKVITPDIKWPGKSRLMLIDLMPGKNRLGGSALAQAYGQIGNECPDVDDPKLLKNSFLAVQQLIREDLILAGHDRSDGGLITTLSEMAMAGNCGFFIEIEESEDLIPKLFSEELGLVIEYSFDNKRKIVSVLDSFEIPWCDLGFTDASKSISIRQGYRCVAFKTTINQLLQWWEATSDRLEQFQMNPELAKEQARSHTARTGPKYFLTFKPEETPPLILSAKGKPKVAILREEGSNSDREMASMFLATGFEPWDVTMTDLLSGAETLDKFTGLTPVGGFSYGDDPESAKGWAAGILFNEKLREMFDKFYYRPNTFSFWECNGCQLAALLSWVPWRGIPGELQPRFIRNLSRRFESRWATVKILDSPAIMLKGMVGSTLGIWVAHGEGKVYFPDEEILKTVCEQKLAPIVYVDDEGNPTEKYPFNLNGSPFGITALCSEDGRHLAMMPHPTRAFLKWQWAWMPEEWKETLKVSPWLMMFQNAYEWCRKN